MRLTDEQIERIEKMWSVPKSHEIPRLIADLRAYKTALEELSKCHRECDDCWYSCPQAEDYCGEDYSTIPINERPCFCSAGIARAALGKE